MTISGSCLCGGVRFEIERACGPVEMCHCNRCRKLSGSSGLPMIGVKAADFRFLEGRDLVRTYSAPILYEPPAYQASFCSNCGSPAPPPDPGGADFEIPAGLFDEDPLVTPDRHIFVDFAPPWCEFTDSLPRYTMRELFELRHGRSLPEDFAPRSHYGARR